MANIVLTTLNAKYIHAAFGLRYLLANLGSLRGEAELIEFDINQRVNDVVEVLLAREPKIIGLGVYIWNVALSAELVATLKRVRPEVLVVLGGPEVSYETEDQSIIRLADYVITGEADQKFAELCRELLEGRRPDEKVITSNLPDLQRLSLPYEFYTDADVAHRVIYVEASRGCPFKCEFCLSSLDIPVRQFPLSSVLASFQALLDRGVRQFKFVDRTFNLNLAVGQAILSFFLERYRPGLFLHFEMIPDRLPEALRETIARFPKGSLQFEIGIQTFNEDVAQRIQRRQDNLKVAENLTFLRESTGVHVHADLIAGLPGESLESFALGFDRLVALRPHEIQVGILKRLRGTPISRHDLEWGMVYNPLPPYEILQNHLIRFADMQRVRRLARYWDLVANSGNFLETTLLIWKDGLPPFASFLEFSDWIFARVGRSHGIALANLAERLFEFLTTLRGQPSKQIAEILARDFQRAGRRDPAAFLKPHLSANVPSKRVVGRALVPKRQARHLAGGDALPAAGQGLGGQPTLP